LQTAFREIRLLVQEAVSAIHIIKGETRGVKPFLALERKALALLPERLIGKSNGEVSGLILFRSL